MKKLIVFGFLLSRFTKEMHSPANTRHEKLSAIPSEEYYNWPGKLDTVEPNIFHSKLRRRLSY